MGDLRQAELPWSEEGPDRERGIGWPTGCPGPGLSVRVVASWTRRLKVCNSSANLTASIRGSIIYPLDSGPRRWHFCVPWKD